tara:strand:- start:31 stop:1365 length:1335 start_codon:yes stop_codon:yes gene_type:complete
MIGVFMKKFLSLILFTFFLCTSGYAKTEISDIKKSIKEDRDGLLKLEGFHPLNAPHAINPVSVSDFSIIGKTSIRFESNDGECGQEPNWNDCPNDRERAELNYWDETWKKEKWYRFYLFLPKDYNSIAPAKMSLIQWKRLNPSKVLVIFQHMHAGLTFNRNGETFPDSYIVLKSNEELLGNWTEIIFNTNWHPDPKKGFMKVWIDRKLKVDFKGQANSKDGKRLNLRYGLYSSYMSYYKNTYNNNTMPQRVAFYDGVKAEKKCRKLLDTKICKDLVSQTVEEYTYFLHHPDDKELNWETLCPITPAKFETATKIEDFGTLCSPIKPKIAIETTDVFDGRYSFTMSRFNANDGSKRIGKGYIDINNGIMTVSKEGRKLDTGSTDLFDSFTGQIDKNGNVSSYVKINVLTGKSHLFEVNLIGAKDDQLQGEWDHYFDVILKLGKKE